MMSPLRLLPIMLLLGLPFLEIMLLILAGQWIGFWATLGLLFLSAIAGMLIIRRQGVAMFGRMFDSMSQGGKAIPSLVDTYAAMAAGCLLIVPGFITDAIGLALLFPPLRRHLLRSVLPSFAATRRPQATPAAAAPPRTSRPAEPIVIEGTYQRLDDDDKR
jgi:UPF0716 protein FxsA